MSKKIAVIFPGVGYHTDKPLLYYGKKLAKEYGYEIIEVNYGGFPKRIKGDAKKMRKVFDMAMEQTENIISKEKLTFEEEILVISKSVGTAVAAAWEKKHHIHAKNIYFTPVEATFAFVEEESGIVFHGTGDSWMETPIVEKNCEKLNLPLYLTPDANHSMEIGDTRKDLLKMAEIMGICEEYISK